MDISGHTYQGIKVISYSHFKVKHYWNCVCFCGNEFKARANSLRTGDRKSCGCVAEVNLRASNRKHGKSKTREYVCWALMLRRCNDPKTKAFKYYGGRGIKVCERWANSFETFLLDVGIAPSPEHTIDRINTDGNYEPSNCRWATRIEQANNTRANRFIYFEGKIMTITQWGILKKINLETLRCRLKSGWSIEKTLTTPVKRALALCLIISIASCGPSYKLRRAERLIKKAELLGAQWHVDSIQVEVPVILKEIRVDSIFRDKVGDTVVITKDRLKVTYVRLPGDSVFIRSESKADTVYQTVTRTVQKVIYAPDKGLKWWHFVLIGFFGAIGLYFIIRK